MEQVGGNAVFASYRPPTGVYDSLVTSKEWQKVKGPEKAQKRLRGKEIQSHVAYNAQELFSRRPRFMVGKND